MDLDADGNKDILSGSYSRSSQPMAGLFQVLRGQEDGSFEPPAVLKGVDDEPLTIPSDSGSITESICTRPMALDWDGDDTLDLVVGNFAGSFYVFKGKGRGNFLPSPEQIMVPGSSVKDTSFLSQVSTWFSGTSQQGAPLKIEGVHSDPFPVDWDNDGDLDLLSGSSRGGVQWAENVAEKGKPPKFEGFDDLIEPAQKIERGKLLSENDLVGPAQSTRVWVDDVNDDGKLDILVGDSVTLVSLPEGVDEQESAKRQAEWQAELSEASQAYSAATNDEEKQRDAMEKLQQLYGERSNFIVEDRTGFVWLYVQK